jgi:urease accessory protein
MRRIEADAAPGSAHRDTLTLPFLLRQKSRLRARLDSGEEVALLLPRGRMLRGGELLRADDGGVVLVRAAAETVSTADGLEPQALARGAYHLGNRHVPVEVGPGYLRYQHDHVLDDMLRALGLRVRTEQAAFEPEGGAYANGHSHANNHVHAHDHDHAHDHVHVHDHAHVHAPGSNDDR